MDSEIDYKLLCYVQILEVEGDKPPLLGILYSTEPTKYLVFSSESKPTVGEVIGEYNNGFYAVQTSGYKEKVRDSASSLLYQIQKPHELNIREKSDSDYQKCLLLGSHFALKKPDKNKAKPVGDNATKEYYYYVCNGSIQDKRFSLIEDSLRIYKYKYNDGLSNEKIVEYCTKSIPLEHEGSIPLEHEGSIHLEHEGSIPPEYEGWLMSAKTGDLIGYYMGEEVHEIEKDAFMVSKNNETEKSNTTEQQIDKDLALILFNSFNEKYIIKNINFIVNKIIEKSIMRIVFEKYVNFHASGYLNIIIGNANFNRLIRTLPDDKLIAKLITLKFYLLFLEKYFLSKHNDDHNYSKYISDKFHIYKERINSIIDKILEELKNNDTFKYHFYDINYIYECYNNIYSSRSKLTINAVLGASIEDLFDKLKVPTLFVCFYYSILLVILENKFDENLFDLTNTIRKYLQGRKDISNIDITISLEKHNIKSRRICLEKEFLKKEKKMSNLYNLSNKDEVDYKKRIKTLEVINVYLRIIHLIVFGKFDQELDYRQRLQCLAEALLL